MNNTGRYRTNSATLHEEITLRKQMLSFLKRAKNIDGSKAYAIAYGAIEKDGKKKLFKHCPLFPNEKSFDKYVKSHKQIILAVYNR